MPNIFDQFDEQPTSKQESNIFDQFDSAVNIQPKMVEPEKLINKKPVFSDEPEFLLPVGEPSMGLQALNVPFVPLQQLLRSPGAVSETDLASDIDRPGPSILDLAGKAGRFTEKILPGGVTPEDPYTETSMSGDLRSKLAQIAVEQGVMIPYATGMGKLIGGLSNIGKTPKAIDLKISNEVEKGISKGIRDTQRGKIGWMDQQRYMDRASVAVQDIIENKPKLKLTDKHGYEISGKLPENLKQMSQSINQGLERIWKEGDELIKQATGKEARVDLSLIGDKIEDMATVGLKLGDKTAYNHVLKLSEELKNAGSINAKDAVEMIKRINSRIKSQIQSGKKGYTMSGKGYVDYEANVLIREQLDSIIENLTGKRYQPIRDKYAAYKTIEKDTINRLIVDARKNKYGLMDIMDVFSGYHAVRGLLTFDVPTMTAAFSSKVISFGQKLANDPNRIVAKMFKNTETLMNKKPVTIPIKKAAPVAPKQIGWEGVFTRGESGEPISMYPGQSQPKYNMPPIKQSPIGLLELKRYYEPYGGPPSELLKPNLEYLKSSTPKKPVTELHPAEVPGHIPKKEPTIYKFGKKRETKPTPLIKPSSEFSKSEIPYLSKTISISKKEVPTKFTDLRALAKSQKSKKSHSPELIKKNLNNFRIKSGLKPID